MKIVSCSHIISLIYDSLYDSIYDSLYDPIYDSYIKLIGRLNAYFNSRVCHFVCVIIWVRGVKTVCKIKTMKYLKLKIKLNTPLIHFHFNVHFWSYNLDNSVYLRGRWARFICESHFVVKIRNDNFDAFFSSILIMCTKISYL